jgi:putative transposase
LDGAARRCRKLQQKLARQRKDSANRTKTLAEMRRIKLRERHRRGDFCAWTANRLATRHGLIAIEDLKTRNMTRSARGTVEEPGKHVAQKAGLNRRILDKGWHALELALLNVAGQTGGRMVKVPAHFTSQRRSECHGVEPASRESQAVYQCPTGGREAAGAGWPLRWLESPAWAWGGSQHAGTSGGWVGSGISGGDRNAASGAVADP